MTKPIFSKYPRGITWGKFYFYFGAMLPVPTKAFRWGYFDISYKIVRLQIATPWFWIGIKK